MNGNAVLIGIGNQLIQVLTGGGGGHAAHNTGGLRAARLTFHEQNLLEWLIRTL